MLLTGWRREMSVWPLQKLSPRPVAASRIDPARPQLDARLGPSSSRTMLLPTGIIVIGLSVAAAIFPSSSAAQAAEPADGSILPFPPTPSASVAGPTLQESTHQRRVEPNRLPEGAPNILIILLDDVGFGLPDTFGGEIHTPTLSRLAQDGVSYSAFHTTSICSPTRAVLLT